MSTSAKQNFNDATQKIEDQATTALHEAKNAASTARDTLAEAGDKIVGSLRSTAEAATNASARVYDSVTEVAENLRKRDLNDIVGDAKEYARRNPGTVAIGAAVAGFAFAHLLKAASRQSSAERLYNEATRRASDAVSRVRDGGWRG